MKSKFGFGSTLVAMVFLAATGCGGPLAHTVKLSEVPKEHRGALADEEKAVEKAEQNQESAEQRVDKAVARLAVVEAHRDESEHDVKIATKQIGVEEAKEEADRSQDVAGAQGDLKRAEHDLVVAEANFNVESLRLDLAEKRKLQADSQWLVVLARYQVAKLKATGGTGADHEKREAELQEQLAEQIEKLSEATKGVEKGQSEVAKASDKLIDLTG